METSADIAKSKNPEKGHQEHSTTDHELSEKVEKVHLDSA